MHAICMIILVDVSTDDVLQRREKSNIIARRNSIALAAVVIITKIRMTLKTASIAIRLVAIAMTREKAIGIAGMTAAMESVRGKGSESVRGKGKEIASREAAVTRTIITTAMTARAKLPCGLLRMDAGRTRGICGMSI